MASFCKAPTAEQLEQQQLGRGKAEVQAARMGK